jgi:Flp pilus assembly protein TadG
MNNKGQVLVFTIILIPIIILLLGFVIDYGLMVSNKNKLTSIGNIAIREYQKKNVALEITINKNDTDILIIKKEINNNKVNLILEKEYNTIFGNIIGYKKYTVRINVRG